jgi:hypothetical protein
MGIATCSKPRHAGVVFDFILDGAKISGDFAQTHLARKLIASWLIMGAFCNPPGMFQNLMRGKVMGVVVV